MSIFDDVKNMPALRPNLNVGCLFDLITSNKQYHEGVHGNSILNGGFCPILAIQGPQNSFKSAIEKYFILSALDKYSDVKALEYDSENSGTWDRVNSLASNFDNLRGMDFGDETLSGKDRRLFITTMSDQYGDEWFDTVRNLAKGKLANAKEFNRELPFIDDNGKAYKFPVSTLAAVDSLSRMDISDIAKKNIEAVSIGDSKTNTVAMTTNKAKQNMINQMTKMTSANQGMMHFIMTAHVGKEFQLEMFPTKEHKSPHAMRGYNAKNVSSAYGYLTTVVYEIQGVKILYHTDKNAGVRYPKVDALDRNRDSSDLLEIELVPFRNKRGPSGIPLYLVVSQREGLRPHLTQYHFMTDRCPLGKPWGINGDPSRHFELTLLPGKSLQRTSIRTAIDEDPMVRRAIELTSDLLQIKILFTHLPDDHVPTPEALIEDLKKKGYNWEDLLNTRNHWVYADQEKELPPQLTAWDLIRMYHNNYKPYWMK